MIDSHCRAPFQKAFIDPVFKFFPLLLRISPFYITLLAMFCGALAAPLLFFKQTWLALFFILFSAYCDILDGSLAREAKKSSNAGAVLDVFCDRFVEFCIILGLYLFDPARALYCLLMLGSAYLCVCSFLLVAIFKKNNSQKSFHYSPGLIERTEAFFLFTAMLVFPKLFILLALAFTILTAFTAFVRIGEFFIQDLDIVEDEPKYKH